MSAVLDVSVEEPAAALHTTLYDLISAMQDEIEPGNEHLVVSAILHLLRSSRITFLRKGGELEKMYAEIASIAYA